MNKKHLIIAFFVALVTAVYGQSNLGIDYFALGEYQIAKKYFENQVSQKPTAESYYYLGEIAYAEGNMDQAKAFYAKGIETEPTYMLNYIGQGKLLLKTDKKEAETAFSNALKNDKKDAGLNVAIAQAYYVNGMKDLALTRIALAEKYNKKSALIYTFEGDILQDDAKLGDAGKKLGEAGQKYEQATYFDTSYTIASLKYAILYQSINPETAIDLFLKIFPKHPDYTVINKYLGQSYHAAGRYPEAIESYKTYFAEKNYMVDDIIRFASDYYFTDKFDESVALINEGLQREPDNFVLNRFKMYNASKTKDASGLSIANRFFSLPTTAKSFFTTEDTLAYGRVLANAGQYEKSLDQYNKVLASGNVKADTYKDIATTYTKMGDDISAIDNYLKYIDLIGSDNVLAIDYFKLGSAYYAAGTSKKIDSVKAKEYLVKADTIFGIVCQKSSEGSYTGYYWRGNTNAAMDPEAALGLAKPYYEATIKIILNRPNGYDNLKNILIRAYYYMAYYYYTREDKTNSTIYSNKILELDPNNTDAKTLLGAFNAPKK